MDLKTSTALITGANRGLGRHFAEQLVQLGAKVYATARRPEDVRIEGVHVLRLDITDPASVAAAAAAAPDVNFLINNAGVATRSNLVTGDFESIQLEMDTHFFGTLRMVRAFAPVLGHNGGGAILNVLSVLSWFASDGATSYSAAKAAEWSLTNGIRLELTRQGTQVTGIHLAAADTDMMAGYDGEMLNPADVVRDALAGVAAGRMEVLADAPSIQVKAALAHDPSVLYPQAIPVVSDA